MIFRIGYGLLTICLLSSRKSVIVRTVMSFFGMINVGEAHCDDDCLFITPIPTSLLISFIRVALCICGMGYGLPWYHLAPSFSSIETGGRFQSPNVLPKSDSYLSSNESSFSHCNCVRWEQLSLTIAGRFALSYLVSSISITLFGGISSTNRFLSLARVVPQCSGYARFEMQVRNIPYWEEDIIYGNGLLFEVQYCPDLVQCLLANDEVIQRCRSSCFAYKGAVAPASYSTMSGVKWIDLHSEYSTKERE